MGQSVNLIEYIDDLIGDDYVSPSQLLEVQEAIEYINRTVHSYELDLTCSESIIQSGGTSVLTATLTDDSVPVANETISFKVYLNGSLIETLTGVTNSNGVATASYTGRGDGYVDIVAELDSAVQSNTLTIEDCLLYDDCTTDKGYWDATHKLNATLSFSSDGIALNGTQSEEAYVLLDITYPTNYQLECEVTGFNKPDGSTGVFGTGGILFADIGSSKVAIYPFGNWSERAEYTGTLNIGDILKFEVNNGTVSVYKNNTLIGSKSQVTPTDFLIDTWSTRGISLKDLKIKPLTVLNVVSDKSVLSYTNNESATLSATLTGGTGAISGETISFYNGETLLGTDTTDSNGEATLVYESQGTGDVTITAKYGNRIQSETIIIEDCYIYNTTEIHKEGSQVMLRLIDDFNFPNTGDWECTYDLQTWKGFLALSPYSQTDWSCDKYLGLGGNSSNKILCALGFTSDINNPIWYTTDAFGNGYHSLKITRVGDVYNFYYDGTLITNTTSTGMGAYTPLYVYVRIDSNGGCEVENLKIKPLVS